MGENWMTKMAENWEITDSGALPPYSTFLPSSFGGWIAENLKALEWTGASIVYMASNLSTF